MLVRVVEGPSGGRVGTAAAAWCDISRASVCSVKQHAGMDQALVEGERNKSTRQRRRGGREKRAAKLEAAAQLPNERNRNEITLPHSPFLLRFSLFFSMLFAARAAAAAATMRLAVLSRAASSTSASIAPPSSSSTMIKGWATAQTRQQQSSLSTKQSTRRRISSVAVASGNGGSSNLEPPDVRQLAKMAQLEVTDEEVSNSAVKKRSKCCDERLRRQSSRRQKHLSFNLDLNLTPTLPTPDASQVADWEPKIRKIVSWFNQLQAVDLEAEEEKERLAEEGNQGGAGEKKNSTEFSLRADEVSQFGGDPADALREAPEKEGDFLKVSRIM